MIGEKGTPVAGSPVTISAAIVTHDRPIEVRRAVDSCRELGVSNIVVLDNGSTRPVEALSGVDVIRSDENLGVCVARNRLLRHVTTDLVLLLDDDASVLETGDIQRVISLFGADPKLAVIAGRVTRPGGEIKPWEFPRRRVKDVLSEGEVGYFLGGACVVRAATVLALGGFDPTFFYGHEETDLALRLVRNDFYVLYSPALSVEHRPSSSGRSSTAATTARQMVNRFVLARRNLPRPVSWIHTGVWRSYYSVGVARGGPGRLREFLQDTARLKKERLAAGLCPEPDRLPYRRLVGLQKRGYRIFW